MLVDITPIICGGVIDNTVRGVTKLTLRIVIEEGEQTFSIPALCLSASERPNAPSRNSSGSRAVSANSALTKILSSPGT